MELPDIKECLELVERPEFSEENYQDVFSAVLSHIQSGESTYTAQLNDLVDELLIAVNCLFDDNERMKKDDIKQLREIVDQLEKDVERLQSLEEDALAGQIASKLEKQFTMIILKDTGIKENLTLNKLYLVAGGNRRYSRYTNVQIDKVNENWDELDKELERNSKDPINLFNVIDEFKVQRNDQAHLDLSLSEASRYLKLNSSYSAADKRKLDRMIEELKRMGVQRTGLP